MASAAQQLIFHPGGLWSTQRHSKQAMAASVSMHARRRMRDSRLSSEIEWGMRLELFLWNSGER